MKTILYHIEKKERIRQIFEVDSNGRGYKYPDERQWQKDRENGFRELVLIEEDRPDKDSYDPELQEVNRTEKADLSVDNEFDGVFIRGWEITDKPQEEIDAVMAKYQQQEALRAEREQKRQEREAIKEELKNSSPIRDDLNNPDRVAELERRVEKLEKLIIDL